MVRCCWLAIDWHFNDDTIFGMVEELTISNSMPDGMIDRWLTQITLLME